MFFSQSILKSKKGGPFGQRPEKQKDEADRSERQKFLFYRKNRVQKIDILRKKVYIIKDDGRAHLSLRTVSPFQEKRKSGYGGTGRRARFRFLSERSGTGSSPATRTITGHQF